MLGYVQYDPDGLVDEVRAAAENALRQGRIQKREVQLLLTRYKRALADTTYLG